MQLALILLPERLGICHLAPGAAVPEWSTGSFSSLSRTKDELSIVCEERSIPDNVSAERAWRYFMVVGPLGFALTGILAAISAPLAEADVSIFAVSTFLTDYILVKDEKLEIAVAALRQAGFEVRTRGA